MMSMKRPASLLTSPSHSRQPVLLKGFLGEVQQVNFFQILQVLAKFTNPNHRPGLEGELILATACLVCTKTQNDKENKRITLHITQVLETLKLVSIDN